MVPQSLAVSASAIFYQAISYGGSGSAVTWLEAVPAYADAGIGTNQVVLDSWGEVPFGGYSDLALVGPTLYGLYEGEDDAPIRQPIFTLSALADGGAPTPFYATPLVLFHGSGWSFAASTALVAAAGALVGDGGVDIVYAGNSGFGVLDAGGARGLVVCPAGPTCTSSTTVSGVDAKSIRALYADPTTLYFTDPCNALFSCDGATALAGSCTPTLLSRAVPPFTELRSDATYVYVLKSDGSAIVRIAR
jgi:hypothetical protein